MFKPTFQCIQWRKGLLDGVSPEDVVFLNSHLDELDQKDGYVAANTWLRSVIERYTLLGRIGSMRACVKKEVERLIKRGKSEDAMNYLHSAYCRLKFCDEWIMDLTGDKLANWADEKSRRFEMGYTGLLARHSQKDAFDYAKSTSIEAGADYDCWHKVDKAEAIVKRMVTPEWWARQAKKQYRVIENIRRECGQVCNQESPYVSRWGINRFRKQKQANRAFLESYEAVNQHEQSFLLSELADKSISNPVNTKAELMVRIKGCQHFAVEHGHVGYFITLTCPSKYHPVHKASGYRNTKFYEFGRPSPRSAQQYLNGVWKKFRTACANKGIRYYGIRTVEPNHDGTPHWHLILFIDKERSADLLAVFRKYALEVDGDEAGANENRFVPRYLDPEKGGAVAYVAKYIAKSVDGLNANGESVGIDNETGLDFINTAERVQAWKSRHGIRQFQFVGGVSVTVWREIRRLKDDIPSSFSNIYNAAKANDWKRFTQLMGGMHSGRKQTLKPFYNTSELNQFGEPTQAIKGLFAATAEVVITRLYEWTVQRVGSGSGSLLLGAAQPFPRTRVNNCTEGNFSPQNYH